MLRQKSRREKDSKKKSRTSKRESVPLQIQAKHRQKLHLISKNNTRFRNSAGQFQAQDDPSTDNDNLDRIFQRSRFKHGFPEKIKFFNEIFQKNSQFQAEHCHFSTESIAQQNRKLKDKIQDIVKEISELQNAQRTQDSLLSKKQSQMNHHLSELGNRAWSIRQQLISQKQKNRKVSQMISRLLCESKNHLQSQQLFTSD